MRDDNWRFEEKEILNAKTNGNVSNKTNGIQDEFEMKMNEMNKMDSEKFDETFHAKIGHGMDINIPIPSNGNVIMNGGTKNMSNGGFVNYGYNTYLDPLQSNFHFDDGHQQFIEDEIDEYDDYNEHEKEVYYIPVDSTGIYVAPCCPDIIYRLMPWCSGDNDSPFWIVWDQQRLLGARYCMQNLSLVLYHESDPFSSVFKIDTVLRK